MLITSIVLIILYIIYRWSVSWIEYYNQLDKRFGMSIWRYSYDYPVVGKRDVSILDDKEFVLLRRKRNRVVTFMYFTFFFIICCIYVIHEPDSFENIKFDREFSSI